MAVRKIRNKWWVDIRHDFTRYRKKSPLNTREGALLYEATLRKRLAAGEPIITSKEESPPTFAEFTREWFDTYVKTNNKPSEQKTKAVILRAHLVPFFGAMPLLQVEGRAIDQFKRIQTDKGLAPKTINNHLAVLRRALSSAEEWDLIPRSPRIQWLRCPPPRIDYLSELEVEQLLARDADPVWDMAIRFALRTGVRVGELLALDWSCVNLERGDVTIQRSVYDGVFSTPKNNRMRQIPLTTDLLDSLRDSQRGSGLVFGRTSEASWSDDRAEQALARACAQADVRHVGWHTLRHTFATQLVERGVPIRDIQKLLGHSSVTMTERYAHVTPSALRRAVERLEAPAPLGQPVGNGRMQGPLGVGTRELENATR